MTFSLVENSVIPSYQETWYVSLYLHIHTGQPYWGNRKSLLIKPFSSFTKYKQDNMIWDHHSFTRLQWWQGRWGHSHWKVVRGCAAVMTPFFQTCQRSLAYQFTINAPLMCPHSQFLENCLIFSLVLAKLSALKMQIFQISFPILYPSFFFFEENPLPRPTFGNLCGTHPPKKKKKKKN